MTAVKPHLLPTLLGTLLLWVSATLWGADTPDPTTVTIPGSLQSELGCPGDWQPECAATHLSFDTDDEVWQAVFNVPAGSWEYKAALNDTWDENYGANAQRDGANIPLNLGAPTDVKFYYDHESHWITDNVNSAIATVAGDFQSELGCPGDWQPDCLRSWLQDADGDGIYGFTTDAIPAGNYEAKVAHDESWDENYGQGGVSNGDNIPFTVPPGATVSFLYNPGSHVLTITTGTGGDDSDLVRPSLRTPFVDEVVYFVLPDRFANGDVNNDTGGNLSSDPLINGYLPTDRGYYHGGDIAGLMGRLDYLQGLGVTSLWITPPFTNRPVQGDGTVGGSSAGYHGYWIVDFTQADPHLGSDQELKDLIAAAHARGMKVFFDIVVNHTADVITYQEGIFAYRNKDDFPYRDASGHPFDDRDFADSSTFPTLDPAISFPYTPIFAVPEDATAKAPAWLNDPLYYHNRGNSTFTGESSLYGDFFGLDDLWTERREVIDGMIDIYQNAITEFGVDGFRVDTVPFVNDELWQRFVPEILTHAAAQGNPDFLMFGEVAADDVTFRSRYTTALPFPSLLDDGFDAAARQFATGGGASDDLRAFFATDDYFIDIDSNAYSLATFIGNHDIGRLGHDIDTTNPGATDAERVARAKLAHALMFFARGMPVIYYGDEQGFVGDGGDKDARQDMLPSQVTSYNDDDLIGTAATTADDNFDVSHPLYQALSDFAALRDAHPALRRGAQLHRYSEGTPGIYAFSRIDRDEQVEYLVALNNSEAADTAAVPTSSPSTTFTNLYPGGTPALASDGSGNITVGVPALDLVVYRAGAAIPPDPIAPTINITTPAEGATVTGRFELGATVPSNHLVEVTFAVSVDGGAYEPIGTDDNAPYRVFYDVSGLPESTALEFKAIANNLSGNISSDTVTATVGSGEPPTTPQFDYAIIHYLRPAGDYGTPSADFNTFWGLHLWGNAIDPSEATEWTQPKTFEGEDEFGRFAWIRRGGSDTQVNFIIHRGDTKDTDPDRGFDADAHPEVWIHQSDTAIYTSQAEAQGFVTIHYHRTDGDYGDPTSPDFNDFWGLHLWGNAIDPSETTGWTDPKRPTGFDSYGAFWEVRIDDASQPVNFIIHRGDAKDPGPDESFVPTEIPTAWKQSGDVAIYPSRGAAQGFATLHYHRNDGDYGDPSSPDFNNFWGLHVWNGATAPNPSWQDPVRPAGQDVFGPYFQVDLEPAATELAYILHRGDTKDPGPDQFLDLGTYGYEVWQLTGDNPSDPTKPHYVLPIAGAAPPPPSLPGDLDGDGDVDRDDLNILLAARNTTATGPDDPRDLDGDGMITVLDGRQLVLLCTRARCATE